jgi:hypothetical protein
MTNSQVTIRKYKEDFHRLGFTGQVHTELGGCHGERYLQADGFGW